MPTPWTIGNSHPKFGLNTMKQRKNLPRRHLYPLIGELPNFVSTSFDFVFRYVRKDKLFLGKTKRFWFYLIRMPQMKLQLFIIITTHSHAKLLCSWIIFIIKFIWPEFCIQKRLPRFPLNGAAFWFQLGRKSNIDIAYVKFEITITKGIYFIPYFWFSYFLKKVKLPGPGVVRSVSWFKMGPWNSWSVIFSKDALGCSIASTSGSGFPVVLASSVVSTLSLMR